MRRHEVTTLRAITRLKEDNSARPTCTSEQALVSAPERDKRWDRLTILCDSQKHTTCLDIHYNACSKHCNSSTDQKYAVSPLLFSWNIMATARGQGFKQLTPQIQIPTRSTHQTFRIKTHSSSSHCVFHSPRTPPRRTESWRIGDGDFTFDASKTRIV